MEIAIIILLVVVIAILIYGEFFSKKKTGETEITAYLDRANRSIETKLDVQATRIESVNRTLSDEMERNRRESIDSNTKILSMVSDNLRDTNARLNELVEKNARQQQESAKLISDSLSDMGDRNRQNNERMINALNENMIRLQDANEKKLTQIQNVVDEKLTNTLTTRLDSSFKTVSEQLQNVYTAMGEMKKLAGGVTDLQRVLTNVKTRGTWAEVQLGNILEQILTGDQFERNVKCKPNSNQLVEFAVKLPGKNDEDGCVYMPIDSKFPVEDYQRLVDASAAADRQAEEDALKKLLRRMTDEAKSIHDLYINPPVTTDFAIMFLATEGLYAEALRSGLADTLQRDYRVTVAGPTTITALLNSLAMGFRTLAIDRHTSEVRSILAATKAQYDKFGDVLDKVKKKLTEAGNQIEEAQRRNRVIRSKLKKVEQLDVQTSENLLGLDSEDASEDM